MMFSFGDEVELNNNSTLFLSTSMSDNLFTSIVYLWTRALRQRLSRSSSQIVGLELSGIKVKTMLVLSSCFLYAESCFESLVFWELVLVLLLCNIPCSSRGAGPLLSIGSELLGDKLICFAAFFAHESL